MTDGLDRLARFVIGLPTTTDFLRSENEEEISNLTVSKQFLG